MTKDDHLPDHFPSVDAPPNYALHASSSGYLVKYALSGAKNLPPGTAAYHVVHHDENHESIGGAEKYVVTRMKQSGTIAGNEAASSDKKGHDLEDDVEVPYLVTLSNPVTNEPIFRADAPTAFDLWEHTSKVGVEGGHLAVHYADLHHSDLRTPQPWHSIAFKIDKAHARFVMTLPPAPGASSDTGILAEHFHVEPAMAEELKQGSVFWQVVPPHGSSEKSKETGLKEVKNEWFWMVLKAVSNDNKSEEDILAYAKIRTTHTQEVFVDLFDPPLVQVAQDIRKKSKEQHAATATEGRPHRIQEHVVVATAWMLGDLVRQRVIAVGVVPSDSNKCMIL
ncbi:hypothetical protein BJ742DRAFT_858349 [Cladochytrium replicatum]|nr:hypothetical protein BJ742DRAFT_858349 [Cladochytrium replicatum]